MSAKTSNCPNCATPLPSDAPKGLCPECLLRGGFESADDAESSQPSGSPLDRTIPIVATLDEPAGGVPEGLRSFGDYELLEEIAEGGMGVVFKARQLSLNRLVAVKMIRSGHLAREADIRRFRTEAEAAANLKHPHIVGIHEVGEHEGRHFFSMDFIAGRSLADLVRDLPLAPARAARLVQTVAEAIAYAHGRGVLHRDLKPSNVMIDAQDQPHVTDFGLAKLLTNPERETRNSEQTQTGAVLGSPSYMSPEQARGRGDQVSVRSDVYALGAMLYELLTTHPPFLAATALETIKMVADCEPVAPRHLNPAVPPDLETICLKCLEKGPSRRYAGAQDLAEELGRFLHHEPIHARPAQIWERVGKWARRHPARAGLIGVSVAAVVTLVTVLGVSGGKLRRERDAVKREQETTAENLYAADMFLGFQALERGNLGLARRALASQRPRPGRRDLRGFEWRWLWGECRGDEVASLAGPGEEINCLAFSPDGRLLAQGGWRTPALLWDWRAGKFLGYMPEAGAPRAKLETDLARILMARPMMLAPVTARGETPASLDRKIRPTESGYITSMAFSGDGALLATGETDRFTKLWRLRDRRLLNVLTEIGCHVAFVPGTNWLVAGLNPAEDGLRFATVGCYDTATMKPMLAFTQANGFFALTRDGRRLALAAPGGPLRVHALPSGVLESTMEFAGGAAGLVFSADDRTLAVIDGSEPRVVLFDVPAAKLLGELGQGFGRIERAVFSPDGRHLATSGADHALRLWNTDTRTPVAAWRGHEAEVRDVAFTPDGKWLVTASKDKTVRFWDAAARRTNETAAPVVQVSAASADGRLVLGRDGSTNWIIWDVKANRALAKPALRTNDVPLGILEEGRALVSARWHSPASTNRLLRLDTASGRVTSEVALNASSLLRVMALSPDGGRVAGARMHGGIALFDGTSGAMQEKATWTGIVEVTALAFSPQGDRLLAVAAPDRIAMWRVPDLHPLWELTNARPASWAFSADGAKLALGQEDNLVTVWNATNGTALAALTGHKQRVSRVAFTRDGATLASAGADGQIRFWHLRTLRELGAWPERGDCDFLNFLAGDDVLCVGRPGTGVRLRRVPTVAEADREAGARPGRAGAKDFSSGIFQN